MKEHEPPRLLSSLNHSLNPGSWATISNLFRSYFSQNGNSEASEDPEKGPSDPRSEYSEKAGEFMNHGHSRSWGFAERCSKVASPSACAEGQDTKAKETDGPGKGQSLLCSAMYMMTLGTDLGGRKEVGKLEAFLKKKERKIHMKTAGPPREAVLGPVA